MHKHKLIMIQKLLYSVMFARNSGKNVELFPKLNSDVSKAFYLDSAQSSSVSFLGRTTEM